MSGGPHERAGLTSLNASRNAEWETTGVTTELPKEGADRWMWVAEVVTGASTSLVGAPFPLRVTSAPIPGFRPVESVQTSVFSFEARARISLC